MRIAVSNIAWEPAEDEAAVELFQRLGIDAIDIAPGKYFPDPFAATDVEVLAHKRWWSDQGIAITGMQALLFGTTGLNLFGDEASRESMLQRLGAICRIAGLLEAPRLVFGSPKNRDRSGLTDEEALEHSASFFERLGGVAAAHGVAICLEPNPPRYGCNFMKTTDEAAAVVRAVGHRAIRLHLDTGTIAINGEDPREIMAAHADIIGHVHASEPDLIPVGDGAAPHAAVAAELRKHLPQKIVSIEMAATKQEPHLQAVERATRFVVRAYGPTDSASAA